MRLRSTTPLSAERASQQATGSILQMASRKKPSEIFLAWESIVFPETGYEKVTSELGRAAFFEIWEAKGSNDKYLALDPEDADLLCTLGWKLAMEKAHYEESLSWTRLMPLHPRFSELDSVRSMSPVRDAFYSFAYLGRIDELCSATAELQANRDSLGWRCATGILLLDEVFPPDDVVDPRILEVAKGVLGAKKRYARLVRLLERPGITYREMREVGMKTFNSSGKVQP